MAKDQNKGNSGEVFLPSYKEINNWAKKYYVHASFILVAILLIALSLEYTSIAKSYNECVALVEGVADCVNTFCVQ